VQSFSASKKFIAVERNLSGFRCKTDFIPKCVVRPYVHTKTTFAYASTRTRTQTYEERGVPSPPLTTIKENEDKAAAMSLIFIKHHAMKT
jgi:hypothetical protein